ncbi:MAG: RNA-protein complex protein Nop10 [Nitrososphaerota archaeon]|uniref:RNA-protein complex protein Nop10 n=1 Tax=Candidatus Bathycorpusculum sp. TaxID=2994959 RepID=UPI0028352DFB|nr:RNA-protein complex protein Nop10 [Candidatus Termitimicrobium sp.]MCL2432479.1 RNA-protein complex protein Nop10 [Candidatus Termitimicrobium sp.]MDR0493116.1 RNA-protein complex protein Nop10 [Nitrososphaerota archaeon]
MNWQLRKCVKCEAYTLNKAICPVCKGDVRIPHPAKFSPDDKYLKYRMAAKRSQQP